MIRLVKLALVWSLFLMVTPALAAADLQTVINGKIKGLANTEVKLVYNRVPFLNKPLELKGKTDSSGYFFFKFGLDIRANLDLSINGKTIGLLISPNDSFYLELDGKDTSASFIMSGKGFEESYLNYLNYQKFDAKIIPTFFEKLSTLDPIAYQALIKTWMKDFEEVKKANQKALNASKPLKQLSDQLTLIKEANYLLFYLNYQKSINPSQGVPPTFAKVLSNPELFKVDYPLSSDYQNFLMLHLTTLGPSPKEDICDGVLNFLQFVDSVYAKNSKDELMARVLWEGLDNGCARKMRPWFDAYMATSGYAHYVQALQEKAAQQSSLQPGDPAPDFEFVDKEGNKHKLADLRGKVIYLDFWATWCGPCIRAMQESGPLKQKFKNNDAVAFVYISTDQDVAKWKNHAITNGGDKYMWHMGENSYAASNAYRIQTIPRYVVIDKEGNIVDPNAPRPYSPEIETILNREAAKPYSAPK